MGSLEFSGFQCEHTGLKSRFSLNPKLAAFGREPAGPERVTRAILYLGTASMSSPVQHAGSPRVSAQTQIPELNVGVEWDPSTAAVLE